MIKLVRVALTPIAISILFLPMVTACTLSPDPHHGDIGSPSVSENVPAFHVVTVPPGWEAVKQAPAEGTWVTLMRDDDCELRTRGTHNDEAVDDERSSSVQLLEQLIADTDDATLEIRDRTFIVEGGTLADKPEAVLEFVTASRMEAGASTVAAARVANTLSFKGEVSSSSLELILFCQHSTISDFLADDVFQSVRPRIGISEVQPWGAK